MTVDFAKTSDLKLSMETMIDIMVTEEFNLQNKVDEEDEVLKPLDGEEFVTELYSMTNPPVCKLVLWEFEGNWGSRPEGEKYFSSWDGAKRYKEAYDGRYNNEDMVPDWYMTYLGPESLTERDFA